MNVEKHITYTIHLNEVEASLLASILSKAPEIESLDNHELSLAHHIARKITHGK